MTLGSWADSLAQSEALKEWELNHPPSSALWGQVFEANGLTRVTDPARAHRIARTLPANTIPETSAGPAVLLSGEGLHAALLGESDSDGVPLIFAIPDAAIPSGWRPVAPGWLAFESAVQELANQWKTRRNQPGQVLPRKPIQARDPREIVY